MCTAVSCTLLRPICSLIEARTNESQLSLSSVGAGGGTGGAVGAEGVGGVGVALDEAVAAACGAASDESTAATAFFAICFALK